MLFVLTLEIFLFLLKSELAEKAAEFGMTTLECWNILQDIKEQQNEALYRNLGVYNRKFPYFYIVWNLISHLTAVLLFKI